VRCSIIIDSNTLDLSNSSYFLKLKNVSGILICSEESVPLSIVGAENEFVLIFVCYRYRENPFWM